MKYFNQTGWTAYFSGVEGGAMARMRDVAGWHPETGVALIVDETAGSLRPVTSYPDFCRLERAGKVVGAIPGGGWKAVWNEEGGDIIQVVLGWLVTGSGAAVPFVVEEDGTVATAESADKLIPPTG